jgi:signal transduction histidine kinase
MAGAARRGFSAAVSNDLRTPITSLRLIAEAVEDDVVDARVRAECPREMRGRVDALSALIDDLFELSRPEAGDIAGTRKRVPLDRLLADAFDAMRVRTGGEARRRARPRAAGDRA